MKPSLANILADPIHKQRLRLHVIESNQDEVTTGELLAEDGTIYPITRGIPRFVSTKDKAQLQTGETFSYKWRKRDTYDSDAAKSVAIRWYAEKYGFKSFEEWVNYFTTRFNILDVGCGSGFSSSLWLDTPQWTGRATWIGVDISDAIDIAVERLAHIPNTHFVQADALQLPFPDNNFDTVFSEGVFHHTPSPRLALFSSSRVLAVGGEINFYVYRKKGPVREFTDDYIREQLASLSDEDAWDVMRSLTRLGKKLWETGAIVEVDEEIPLLGINPGHYPVQRLIYWNFAKLYWNPELSFEENTHVNFDWYRPRYAFRQTTDEVKRWCSEAGLSIQWLHEQDSGITVRAIKK